MKKLFVLFPFAIFLLVVLFSTNSFAYAQIIDTKTLAITYDFLDDFSDYHSIANKCIHQGNSFNKWKLVMDGYGCVKNEFGGFTPYLYSAPKVSTKASEIHSTLVLGPSFSNNFVLQLDIDTHEQQRRGSPPNPWEVGWIFWNYVDKSHSYYLVLKRTGWELGKLDPAYPGLQRFLETGHNIKFPINHWYHVKIIQNGSTMTIYVNGKFITTFTDHERPYTHGKIGLYNEDAQVYFDNVKVSSYTSLPSKQTKPAPPSELRATPVSSSQINLSWNAPSDNGGSSIIGYSILRSRDGGSTWSYVTPNTGSTATSYVHSPISSGSTYSYSVHAINKMGTSDASNIASAKTFSFTSHTPSSPTSSPTQPSTSSQDTHDITSTTKYYVRIFFNDGTAAYYILLGSSIQQFVPNISSYSIIGPAANYDYSLTADQSTLVQHKLGIISSLPPSTVSSSSTSTSDNSQSTQSKSSEKYYVRIFFNDGTAAYYILLGSSIQQFVPNISSYSIIGPAANYGYNFTPDQSTLVQHKLSLI